ncbi:MAG: right-handed parallel beta-helix repeat-containing protein [Planctomycetes bacterium]|nr:right-handed parallel beta-helix repeat-containing protein [Planctomycetota bacterium]
MNPRTIPTSTTSALLLAPLVLALLGASGSARAAVVTVSKNGPITTIQGGIDAAADGDTVRVLAGTYAEAVVIPLQKPGLILQGKGKVILDVRGPGGAALGFGIDIQANGATVRGLSIRNAATLGFDTGDGIRIVGEQALIEKCAFEGNEETGVHVFGDTARIRKCVFRSNGDGIVIDQALNVRVESCAFRASGSGSVRMFGATNAVLDKLTVTEGGNASTISTSGGNSDGVEVTRCKIRLSGDGAVILNGNDCRIANVDVVLSSGGLFVSGDRAVIEKCKLFTSVDGSDAITISQGVDIEMRDNFVSSSSGGSLSVHECSGGFVTGNRAKNTGGDGNSGLEISSCTSLLIENNVVTTCGGDAFRISGANNVLRDCVAKDAGVDGFDILPDATNTRLEACIALRCDAEGFENSSTGVQLVDCVSKHNRLDLANDGTLALVDIVFATGGANVTPEVD